MANYSNLAKVKNALMTPRTFAIGDVHGCDTALRTLLKSINPTTGDTVVCLGDLVDRGPGTKQVLDGVLRLQNVCRVIVIQGNHEEMMLRALDGDEWKMWMVFGGKEALESYGGSPGRIPESHIDIMQSAVDYWETPDNIFIHANLEPAVPLAEQHDAWLRWNHLTGDERWYDPRRRVICGHTPQKSGYPLVFPGWICLDTDCQRSGWLSALDVKADWVYQANEKGGTREFPLGGMA